MVVTCGDVYHIAVCGGEGGPESLTSLRVRARSCGLEDRIERILRRGGESVSE